jgi:Transposase zinc-binding domain
MSRPTLEVADIVRAAGNRFWEKHKSHFAWVHRKVLDAIVRCRTAALGGHRDKCVRCGHLTASYNSCRNRHCPKCQGNVRAKWLAARSAELLPVPYFHIVFTLPHELCALVLQNKRLLYDLLVRTSAASLLELARDPKHLGADIGFLGVLHTWGQNLQVHPTYTTSSPPAALPPMVPDGSTRRPDSSYPSRHSARSSAVSSARNSVNCITKTDSSSTTHSSNLPHWAHSAASSGNSARRTGSFMPSHPSAAPNTFSTTWRAIPIASPSPTIDSWPSRTIACHSAGETMHTVYCIHIFNRPLEPVSKSRGSPDRPAAVQDRRRRSPSYP